LEAYKIKGKHILLCIGIVLLLIFPAISSGSSELISINTNKELLKNNPVEKIGGSETVRMRVLLCDENGKVKDSIVRLDKEDKNKLLEKINQIDFINLTLEEIYKEKIKLLKKYGIISDDFDLEKLIDLDKIDDNFDPYNLTIVQNENFTALSAPILFAGIGFGLGFGYRRLPIIQRFAGTIGFVGVLVVGGLLCFNWLEGKIHLNVGFIYPTFLGFMSGFVGVLMFAVDSLIPPPGGPPFTLYSNFVAIGCVGYTRWYDVTELLF